MMIVEPSLSDRRSNVSQTNGPADSEKHGTFDIACGMLCNLRKTSRSYLSTQPEKYDWPFRYRYMWRAVDEAVYGRNSHSTHAFWRRFFSKKMLDRPLIRDLGSILVLLTANSNSIAKKRGRRRISNFQAYLLLLESDGQSFSDVRPDRPTHHSSFLILHSFILQWHFLLEA